MNKRIRVKQENTSELLFLERSGRDGRDSESISVSVEYVWNCPVAINICHCDCCEFNMENYGDYDIEWFIHIRDDAAQKLASKFQAHDAATLARNFADRFRPYGRDAMSKITGWLDVKGIEYSTNTY